MAPVYSDVYSLAREPARLRRRSGIQEARVGVAGGTELADDPRPNPRRANAVMNLGDQLVGKRGDRPSYQLTLRGRAVQLMDRESVATSNSVTPSLKAVGPAAPTVAIEAARRRSKVSDVDFVRPRNCPTNASPSTFPREPAVVPVAVCQAEGLGRGSVRTASSRP